MTTTIIILVLIEFLLIGAYAYMKPRGGLRSLIVKESVTAHSSQEE